jgi:DNA-binding response OmpR family regulator
MRIGILEDYQSLGYMLELTLKVAGHQVQTAQTIEDFFTLVIASDPPDLMIVDFLLQAKYTGADVIRELRKVAPTQPVILISAAPLPTLRAAVAGIPQVTILQKPFQMSVLRETIQRIFSPV